MKIKSITKVIWQFVTVRVFMPRGAAQANMIILRSLNALQGKIHTFYCQNQRSSMLITKEQWLQGRWKETIFWIMGFLLIAYLISLRRWWFQPSYFLLPDLQEPTALVDKRRVCRKCWYVGVKKTILIFKSKNVWTIPSTLQ